MQFNNFKHCLMSAKFYREISEAKKDCSECHTDNKLSFISRKRQKIHLEHEFIFSMKISCFQNTFLAVLVTQIPVCFNKKK